MTTKFYALEYPEGCYVMADEAGWVEGTYDSQATAQAAYDRLTYRQLHELVERLEGKTVTLPDVEQAAP